MSAGTVTVFMPVYNGMPHLKLAIESILNQSHRDFEFLIINDASTDDSVSLIESYRDPRIRLVHNETNLKLIATLNKGLGLATGDYFAMMHADDIAMPGRLAKQWDYLNRHPNVGVVGSQIQLIGDFEPRIQRYSTRPKRVAAESIFSCPMAHPAVMIRKSMLTQHQLQYEAPFLHAEDWALWSLCHPYFEITNLPDLLLQYRIHPGSVSVKYRSVLEHSEQLIDTRNLQRLGIEPSETDLHIHRQLGRLEYPVETVQQSFAWLDRLEAANTKLRIYDRSAFAEVLGIRWRGLNRVASRTKPHRLLRTLIHRLGRAGLAGAIRERIVYSGSSK